MRLKPETASIEWACSQLFQSYISAIKTSAYGRETSSQWGFQSYISAIKTNNALRILFLPYTFQSYISAIKTTDPQCIQYQVSAFQSYISAIKTVKMAAEAGFQTYFNPTLVRLKQVPPADRK